MDKVVIYGVGDYGKRLYHLLKRMKCQIDYFVQSEEPICDEYEGVKIISFCDFEALKSEYIVLIAIKDSKVVNSIKQKFKEIEYDLNNLYDYSDFIEKNYSKMSNIHFEGDKKCLLCGNVMETFLPGGIHHGLFNTIKVIGGGYREGVYCPYCRSMDRNRWVYWVLREKTNIFTQACKVLHFAPEVELRKRISENTLCDYYAGDIVLEKGRHQIDVTNIPFKEKFFDYIIINHVLEHVKEEGKALEELKRVIKENGKVILSFPIAIDMDTQEKETNCDEERLALYGQKDHVRLYGRDYKKRIADYGFTVHEYIPNQILDEQEIEKYGFLREDILLVCERK
ncbi:MAG: class I SAM-dependent methyltransferase [Lachnospiraceae bacterium]|nr:class I SAM-dependent methyltransferase [Lachnospiraceae bacterium]